MRNRIYLIPKQIYRDIESYRDIYFYLFSKSKERRCCKYTEEVSKFQISYQPKINPSEFK